MYCKYTYIFDGRFFLIVHGSLITALYLLNYRYLPIKIYPYKYLPMFIILCIITAIKLHKNIRRYIEKISFYKFFFINKLESHFHAYIDIIIHLLKIIKY